MQLRTRLVLQGDKYAFFKACAGIMIYQETKWPIPRNAKTQLVVAFPRRAMIFAVLIVRVQKERRKSYANVDIRPAAERLPAVNLCALDASPSRYFALDCQSPICSTLGLEPLNPEFPASKTRRKHKHKRQAAGSRLSGGSLDGESALLYADDSANLERRAVGENVVAIDHTPFVTPWRGG